MKDWERAQREWDRLVDRHGRPESASELAAEALERALADRRVLCISVSRDGFGGGSVWLSRQEPSEREQVAAGDHRERFGYVEYVVFPPPFEATDRRLRILNGNAWESSGEMYAERILPKKR